MITLKYESRNRKYDQEYDLTAKISKKMNPITILY